MMAAFPPVQAVAIRQASSLASVPEVVKRIVSRPSGMVASSRSASSTMPSCRYREWVLSRAFCRFTDWTTVGWACPTTATLL